LGQVSDCMIGMGCRREEAEVPAEATYRRSCLTA